VIVSPLDRLTRRPLQDGERPSRDDIAWSAYKSAEPGADTTHELGELLAALVEYTAKTRGDILRRTAASRERALLGGVNLAQLKLSPEQQSQALGRGPS
jgi:hypothetical protein